MKQLHRQILGLFSDRTLDRVESRALPYVDPTSAVSNGSRPPA